MLDITGLVKVKPMHPGPFKMVYGTWWYSLIIWAIIAVLSSLVCAGLLWFAYLGEDFAYLHLVIWKAVPPIVFFLGAFCELINWHNWRMRKALYYASLKEDLQEKRMVVKYG